MTSKEAERLFWATGLPEAYVLSKRGRRSSTPDRKCASKKKER